MWWRESFCNRGEKVPAGGQLFMIWNESSVHVPVCVSGLRDWQLNLPLTQGKVLLFPFKRWTDRHSEVEKLVFMEVSCRAGGRVRPRSQIFLTPVRSLPQHSSGAPFSDSTGPSPRSALGGGQPGTERGMDGSPAESCCWERWQLQRAGLGALAELQRGGLVFLKVYLFMTVLGLHCCTWASSSCDKWELPASRGARASHWGDFSCEAWAPGTWALVVAAHGLSCSAACGIVSEQGSSLCLLHWQVDSQPLYHQGSPRLVLSADIFWGLTLFQGQLEGLAVCYMFHLIYSHSSSCLSYVLVLFLFYKWGNEEQRGWVVCPRLHGRRRRRWRWDFSPGSLTLKTKSGNTCLGKATCPRLRALSGSLVRNVWDRTSGQQALPSSSCWPGRFCNRRGGCGGASSLPPGAEPAEGAASWLHQDVLVLHFWAGLR